MPYRVEKDESPDIPFVYISYDGIITSEDCIRVVSTCQMDIHKFPFDTQSCNITVGSGMYYSKGENVFDICTEVSVAADVLLLLTSPFFASVNEIQLLPFSNSSRATQFSREVMKSQGEWEFLQLSVNKANFTISDRQWQHLVYTVRNKGTNYTQEK